MLLNFVGNTFEVLLLLKQYCDSIVVPKVPEVSLNSIAELWWDIRRATKRLVFYFFDQNEPSLQPIFIIIEV